MYLHLNTRAKSPLESLEYISLGGKPLVALYSDELEATDPYLQPLLERAGLSGAIQEVSEFNDRQMVVLDTDMPREQLLERLEEADTQVRFKEVDRPSMKDALKEVEPLKVRGFAGMLGQVFLMLASYKTLNPFKLFSGAVGIGTGLLFMRYGSQKKQDSEAYKAISEEVFERLVGEKAPEDIDERLGRLNEDGPAYDAVDSLTLLQSTDKFLRENSVNTAAGLHLLRSGLLAGAGIRDGNKGDIGSAAMSIASRVIKLVGDDSKDVPDAPERAFFDPRRITDWVYRNPMKAATPFETLSTISIGLGAIEGKNKMQGLTAASWAVSNASNYLAKKNIDQLDTDRLTHEAGTLIAQLPESERATQTYELAKLFAQQDGFKGQRFGAIVEAIDAAMQERLGAAHGDHAMAQEAKAQGKGPSIHAHPA